MSGVSRLKYSKKYHTMPIAPYGTDDQGDLSGLRSGGVNKTMNDIVLRGYKDPPAAPKKYRPFGSSMEKAWKLSKITDQAYGVHSQSVPEAAEIPLVKKKSDASRRRKAQ
jgi:hypothetical protein